MRSLVVLAGRSHLAFAQQVADRIGVELGQVKLGEFSNKETSVEVKQNVRDKDVFVIQSGCGHVNNNFMELLIIIHACKIASARRITAVIPSLPYSRQAETPYKTKFNARRYDSWQARPGTLVANLLMTAGVNQVITMDLHDVQFQGFFDVPVDNLMAAPLMIRYIKDNIPHFKDAVIVSPDSGGAKRSRRGSSATDIAERLSLDFGLVHKERKKLEDVEPEVSFVGDVNGRVAIIVDDIIDTASTIVTAATILVKNGATKVYAIITHGQLSGNALELLDAAAAVDAVIVSNSIPQDDNLARLSKLRTFNIAPTFAEAIRRIHNGESVSFLFEHVPMD